LLLLLQRLKRLTLTTRRRTVSRRTTIAKELLAGFAAAAADRLFEYVAVYAVSPAFRRFSLLLIDGGNADETAAHRTKGLDFIDREKAKHEAKRQAEEGTLVFFLFVVFLPSFLVLAPPSPPYAAFAPDPICHRLPRLQPSP
jgi:hypothetical protein